MTEPAPPHLIPYRAGRFMTMMPPIEDAEGCGVQIGANAVPVNTTPDILLSVSTGDRDLGVWLSPDQVQQLREQLAWLADHHPAKDVTS